MTHSASEDSSSATSIGTAEAKRRFSELVNRVGEGECFLVSRHGRPVVALVPPDSGFPQGAGPAPTGLASIAGALAEWDELDDDVAEIYAARGVSADRPAPDLG